MSSKKQTFWENKSLTEMTELEWESLCDGCAQCCLHKIEDDDTGEIFYTYVACRLLDIDHCRCVSYQDRFNQIPDCLKIIPKGFSRMDLLPETCAYRRLSNGKSLKWWHPLITKDPNSIHHANISVKNKAISEENIHPNDIPDCILFQLN